MNKICVAHLIRAGNDFDLATQFLNSYKKFSAGVEHDLLIIYKGFDNDSAIAPYRKLFVSTNYIEMLVSDEGYDITAYTKAIKTHDNYDTYCFLNSYSRILAENWLLKLSSALYKDNVGLAGATGSYQSMYRDQMSSGLMLPQLNSTLSIWEKIWLWNRCLIACILSYLKRWGFFYFKFDPFPNPHIRTNAFVISRATINQISLPKVRSKMDAWLFESGKNGLTKSVKKLGKKVVIVGADGTSYDEKDWASSKIYFQCKQDNLLVIDNLTQQYQNGDFKTRQLLADYAWANKNLAQK